MSKHDRDLLALLQATRPNPLDLRQVPEPEQTEIRKLMNSDPDWLARTMQVSADAYTDQELADALGCEVGYIISFREQAYRESPDDD